MAKEKSTKTQTVSIPEVTFVCKFCGQAKPLSELTLQTRFFPVLTSCLSCEIDLQRLRVEDLPGESAEGEAEEETAEPEDEKEE